MKSEIQVLEEGDVKRAMARITHEVLEHNRGVEGLCVLGIKRRGVPLARMLCDNIQKFENVAVPCGDIDVTMCRDDLTPEQKSALATESHFPTDINDKTVIIVDDVLFTGRTAKAAIETVFTRGRPRSVQLVVLVDRGHRELPIRPDYVGKNIPTAKAENIDVRFSEIDGETAVYIVGRN